MSLKLILLNFFIANTNNISTNNEITEYKEVKYGLIIFSMIIFTINIIGIKKMCQIDHKITFEEWVLISGILETILLLIYVLHKKYEILLTIIQALQIIITLFITRRFLKGYLIFSENDTGPNCYNYYYIILVIVNIIFIIVCLILNILSLKKGIKTYYFSSLITLIYDLFGSITSFILLIFGLKLKKLMIIDKENEEKEVIQKYENNNSKDSSFENTKRKKFSQTFLLNEEIDKDLATNYEIFFNTRITQLNIIIWITFSTDFIECISSIFEMIYHNEFSDINGEQKPTTQRAYFIRLIYILCIIISTFMNWFTLYFIVRKSFEIKNDNNMYFEKSEETNMIILDDDYSKMRDSDRTNQNIDNFLKI